MHSRPDSAVLVGCIPSGRYGSPPPPPPQSSNRTFNVLDMN